MPSLPGRTLSLERRPGGAVDHVLEPHLFLVLQAPRPLDSSTRYRLGAVDEVRIGRGSRRRHELDDRKVRVVVADGWMSLQHAVLTRQHQFWQLTDERSKNGTLVNGERVRDAALADGDVIEIGQTLFLFRYGLATPPDAPPTVRADQLATPPGVATLIPALGARFDELGRIAASKTSLVLHGATGTGKEVLAGAVHELSGRRGAFVPVNCAALPEGLVESELFGHVRGAFSGADRDRAGLIAASDGGTLFLDEIGDLPLGAQAKLLRALQEQEVRPVGATAATSVDLRVVAATHRDLGEQVAKGQFREDLLARLGASFELPPLRERREDLGLLIAAILGRIEDPRAAAAAFSCEAARALLGHAWPRNVRELHKGLERAIALAAGGPIALAHLPEEWRGQPAARSRPRTTAPSWSDEDQARRDQLASLLREHRGNVAAVARAMGVVRSQIQRWMKKYGLTSP